MVSHETVGCYEDKALPSEGPGQIPCTFVEHFSLFALSSQGIGLRIQRAGGFFFAAKAEFFFFIQDIYHFNCKELIKKKLNYNILNNRDNRHTYIYLHFTIIYITATKQPCNC